MSMLDGNRRQRNKGTLGKVMSAHRLTLGYSQEYVADRIGVKYGTQVSQMELGYVSVPPRYWRVICSELQIEPAVFFQTGLKANYSDLYMALFGRMTRSSVEDYLRPLL